MLLLTDIGDLFIKQDAFGHLIALTVAFISGILSPIVAQWAKSKFSKQEVKIEEEETDEILKLLRANDVIDRRIESFRQEHNFDRVWIAQFHNGGSFYPAEKIINKFQKFSLTYEACKSGVASDLSAIQNIPVSIFSNILRKVKEDGHYGVDDIANTPDDCVIIKSFWYDRGVKGFHIAAIKCLKKKFLGFIVVDSVLEPRVFNKELVESLIIESKILGGYLVKEDLD